MTKTRSFIPSIGAFIASAFTGISLVATKSLVKPIGALPLGFLRYGTGGVILLGGVLPSKNRKQLLRVKTRDLPILTWIGIVSFCLFPLAYGTALKHMPATAGAVLFATTPLFSAALAYVMRKEKVALLELSGIVLTLVGVAVLAYFGSSSGGPEKQSSILGQGLMLAASFLMALSGILLRPVLARYQSITVSIYRMLLGSAGTLVVALINDGFFFTRLATLSLSQVGILIYLAVGGGAIGYALWTYSLSKLPPAQVFVFLNVSPLVAATLGVVVLGEHLTRSFLFASLLILGGVIACQVSKARTAKRSKK